MYTVTFRRENSGDVKVPAAFGDNLITLAQQAGVAIDAPCGGSGACGKCRVRLIGGTVDCEESSRLSREEFDDGWRLACRSSVCGDAVIWLPAASSDFVKGIRTADLSSPEELRGYERAMDAVFASGLSRGVGESGLGLAVDIGTTTVSAALLDLASGRLLSRASAGNGQIRYGADVINRIIAQGRSGGVDKLKSAVLDGTVIPLINELCTDAAVDSHSINRAVIAGNTTMEHLFVGEDAASIRLEPYVPAFLELRGKTASGLGLPLSPDAPVILAPNVGSYVGGDITAGTLASMIWDKQQIDLFIDLGTNGELVLGGSDFLLCCACSAGPAFEGGDIGCGMRATNGAVESCAIDAVTMEPTLGIIGDGEKIRGLCGSGLIDLVSELFRCGIINAKGRFIREGRRVLRDEYSAAYIIAFGDESATGADVVLGETDIDSFIRAKGAVFSAIQTMLLSLDMSPDCIDHVYVAGGIGGGINVEKCIGCGMLPKLPLERYSYIGNSSLIGACAMLLSDEATEKVFELGRGMTYLELSTYPGYMENFIAACFLPHTDAKLFE